MSDARPTLLVADDYPENRQLFSIYLRKLYEVEAVSSGEAALDRLRDGDFAAALLDLSYQGGLTGFDVLREIRADSALAGLPTLALTAHATSEDRDRCLNAGFDAYLAKPVTRVEMLAAVEALLAAKAAA